MALAAVGESGAAIPTRSYVQLVNNGNANLVYEIRPAGGAWTQHTIAKGSTASFDCSDCVGFEMRLSTGDKAGATHVLQSGYTYQIFWNASRDDLFFHHAPDGQLVNELLNFCKFWNL